MGSGFDWSGDTTDIINAYNDGRFLMIHRDHGWPGGWLHPGFSTSNLSSLHNGDLVPVVYSINCASGLFDNETSGTLTGTSVSGRYFAESLLQNANGGAVGVIGDTRNYNTWSNNAFLRGLIDATWPNHDPSFGATQSITRLGDILNIAKTYTVMQIGAASSTPEVELQYGLDTINLYHVYGDPTLEMWTHNPHFLRIAGRVMIVDQQIDKLSTIVPLMQCSIQLF